MNMSVETLADPIAAHAQAMIAHIGEDPLRPGLAETPERFAAALRFLTGGYEAEPEDVVGRGDARAARGLRARRRGAPGSSFRDEGQVKTRGIGLIGTG